MSVTLHYDHIAKARWQWPANNLPDTLDKITFTFDNSQNLVDVIGYTFEGKEIDLSDNESGIINTLASDAQRIEFNLF